MNAPTPNLPELPADASPVMAQFFAAKARQPDALLFFRMGDFYELFFEDAVKASQALGLTLTKRGRHAGEDIAMAGVPVHTCEAYVAKLIRQGFKVAVCEQLEDPAQARKRGSKAVVHRDVVRVVTPGTLTEDGLLDARGSNRLAAVSVRQGRAALASVEISTGEVESLLLDREDLASALGALRPSETLVPDRLFADEVVSQALKAAGGALQPMAAALAEPQAAEARLMRLYGVGTLDGFGDFAPAEISALGLIAAYIETTQAGKGAGAEAAAARRRGRVHGHRPGHPRLARNRPVAVGIARRFSARRRRPHGELRRRAVAGGAAGPPLARSQVDRTAPGCGRLLHRGPAVAPSHARASAGSRRHGARGVAPALGRGGPRDLGKPCVRA